MSNIYPKVSIFVITYNQVDLVSEAVMSCVVQDYENIEIVISDDGSVDGTVSVLSELQSKYPDKINLILNPFNQGIAKNSNIALSNCSGDLIAFMGGDDVLYPTKISIQVAAFMANPKLVFCYHPCHVMQDGVITETIGDRKKDLVRDFYEMISNYGAQIPGPVPMIARWAVPPGGFNEGIPTACDWLLFIEIAAKGEVIRLNEPLAIYRKHSNNIGKKIFEYGDDFLLTISIVEKKFSNDKKVISACNKGKKRFLLGIIYNSITAGNDKYFNKYFSIYRRAGGKLVIPLFIVKNMPFSRHIFVTFRKFFKKFF